MGEGENAGDGSMSVVVNVFFRSFAPGAYAAGRDVYGNRDVAGYENGRRELDWFVERAQRLGGQPGESGGGERIVMLRRAVGAALRVRIETRKEKEKEKEKEGLRALWEEMERKVGTEEVRRVKGKVEKMRRAFRCVPEPVAEMYLERLVGEVEGRVGYQGGRGS
ncbi:hypothetical protein BDY21DRAFT_339152 [Lineolata rhizophorae]|uniref:Uncharacterized protein n=1 Tax=Lineolata rhizophorae TaxID=578093 RepID=A0A6A6P508_9PEZI|nr:hypothetical protein BDY21DRAFT_339152 [Lineolata rhizophorae]